MDKLSEHSRIRTCIGTHILAEFWGPKIPVNLDQINALLKGAAQKVNATILGDVIFTPKDEGFAAILLLAESHLAVHAAPEKSYMAIDIFTCGDGDYFNALTYLNSLLKPEKIQIEEIGRGELLSAPESRPHESEVNTPPGHHDKDWFFEHKLPGRRSGNVRHSFRIRERLYEQASRFQDIQIFDNPMYGRVLALDGVIQFTEADEFIYHEMLVHPVLLSHPGPSRILVLGGGDGGILRESLRYQDVDQVVLVEIDQEVIEVCREFFPEVSQGAFEDPRVEIRPGDAREIIKEYHEHFDIVVVDSSDSIGSTKALHSVDFYQDIHRALKPGGMMTSLMGSFLDHVDLRRSYKQVSHIFQHLSLTRMNIPSYNCGEYCFLIASKTEAVDRISLETLEQRFNERLSDCRLKYYTPQMQLSSRLMPPHLNICI